MTTIASVETSDAVSPPSKTTLPPPAAAALASCTGAGSTSDPAGTSFSRRLTVRDLTVTRPGTEEGTDLAFAGRPGPFVVARYQVSPSAASTVATPSGSRHRPLGVPRGG